MAFSDLLNHTARVWRRTVTTGPNLREERVAYVPLAIVRCTKNRPGSRAGTGALLGDTGPGLTAIGDRKVYMEAAEDVIERDVLEFLTGPDVPETLEINSPPTRPRDHHLELVARLFSGTLPPFTES